MKGGIRRAARIIAFSWAGFWMIFFVAESTAYRTPLWLALPWVTIGILLIVLSLTPLYDERMGGLLLMAAGLAGGVAYTIWSPSNISVLGRVLATAFFTVPPLCAGILFLIAQRNQTSSEL